MTTMSNSLTDWPATWPEPQKGFVGRARLYFRMAVFRKQAWACSRRRAGFRPGASSCSLSDEGSDPEGSKLDVASVVLKADVALQGFLTKFGNGRLIQIDDQLAVERHFDPRAGAGHVDAVPLSGGADRVFSRRQVAIERPLEWVVTGFPASSNNWIS